MNLRTIPDSSRARTPTPRRSRSMERPRRPDGPPRRVRQDDIDLFVAIVGGLVDAQLANDPAGTRGPRLLDRAVDMFADDIGLPQDS